MAYTTINKHTDYFNTKLYTGNGSSQSVTGVGFQPDWVWLKERSSTSPHKLLDAVRGATKELESNTPNVEATEAQSLTAFGTDGFTVGSNGAVNENSQTYAAWNWKANGQGSANTDGSINSTVSVNTTAGFSIVKWVGTGANGTIGHGLNAVPKLVIVKCLDAGVNWFIYHQATGNTKELYLNSAASAYSGTTAWNSTTPTSSVVYLGAHDAGANKSGDNQIAYCFAEKAGYSKFGSYTGNGNADGTFVYTGFKPALVITKANASSRNWVILDNKRLGYNDKNYRLFPNLSNAEDTTSGIVDITSNGFKFRSSNNSVNESGVTYIYMAFGQSLVGSNNVPANAR